MVGQHDVDLAAGIDLDHREQVVGLVDVELGDPVERVGRVAGLVGNG